MGQKIFSPAMPADTHLPQIKIQSNATDCGKFAVRGASAEEIEDYRKIQIEYDS